MQVKNTQVRNIPLTDIVPSELNPRKEFNQEELEELAQSIKENGLIQPITVRRIGNKKDGKYEIVCGERRFHASQLIGATEIQAIVKELDDKEAFTAMIIENLQRKDIDPMEEAAALFRLYYDSKMTVAEIAKLLGKSPSFVISRIQLHKTIPEFVALMKSGKLVLTHLLFICNLTADQQKTLYTECFTEEQQARWGKKWPNIQELHQMVDEHVMCYLKDARFSTEDDTFDFATSCEECPLNTKNADGFKDGCNFRCMKPECFKRKALINVFRNARKAGCTCVYQGTAAENSEIINVAEAFGLPLTGIEANRTYVMAPTPPDEAAFTDKEAYARRKASYDNIKAVFDDNIKEGTITPVYEVGFNGHLSGEQKYLYSAPVATQEPNKVRQMEDLNRKIADLRNRLAESDNEQREQLVEKQRTFMEACEYSTLNNQLSDIEECVFLALLFKRLPLSFKDSIGTTQAMREDYRNLRETFINYRPAIIREFIRSALAEKSVCFSLDLANMLNGIMEERFGHVTDQFSKELSAKFETLRHGYESKIREAQDSLSAIEDIQKDAATSEPEHEQDEDESTTSEETATAE